MAANPKSQGAQAPNSLEAFWLPFTANRAFKAEPRLVVRADGMHYFDGAGRTILDGASGLWCVNAGHNVPEIVEAIRAQAGELDYAPPFQFGHPRAFEFASRIAALAPEGLDHVFFGNSGSEGADSALKIALGYQRARGEAGRVRIIGRERGYHGTGFAGMTAGGIAANRKQFGTPIAGVDHLPSTYNREKQAYSKGEPEWGAHLADELERLVVLHDASTIAAVMVEPMAGSGGVLPAPKGYLQRLREITSRHGIVLIFDEVITGFGRLGHAFAAGRYGVTPDMIVFAKGATNGAAPLGGVVVKKEIYDAFMSGPKHFIELFHGYTYSGHPLACAAGLAALNVYRDRKLFERARKLEPVLEAAMHSLKGARHVVDVDHQARKLGRHRSPPLLMPRIVACAGDPVVELPLCATRTNEMIVPVRR